VRLVQYYFGTKRQFLLATHQAVVADAGTRFAERLSTLGADPAPRDVIRAILTELLPTDAERRRDTMVLNSFHAAALTGSDVVAEDTLGAPRFLVRTIAEQLRRFRGDPAEAAGRAADLDAELIVAGTSGLAQTLLVDDGVEGRVGELLDRLLDRLVEG
jgi:AcrR family transcriptional regulator